MKLISPELSRRALVAGMGACALPAQAQPRTGTRPRALALIGDRYLQYIELQKHSIRGLPRDL